MHKIEELKLAIAEGKTEYVIECLMHSIKRGDESYKDMIVISARFKKYLSEKHTGITSNDELNIEINRINAAIIYQIEKINSKNYGIKKLGRVKTAFILGIFASFVGVTGYSLKDFNNKEKITEPSTQPVNILSEPKITEPIQQKEIHLKSPKNQTNLILKDKAKAGAIITGDSNKIDLKQDF